MDEERQLIDLNQARIPGDQYSESEPLTESGAQGAAGEVRVFFRRSVEAIAELLMAEDPARTHVLGAVAWLTHPGALDALSRLSASIVVQKEDFLRPDSGGLDGARLREMYGRINCRLDRYELPGIAGKLSTSGDPGVGGVRCVGNHNADRRPACPRMHNKFLVICDIGEAVSPRAVITGSANLTVNSGRSLENVVVINDSVIADAYATEWAQIFALSEPLDWSSRWTSPEWRLGT